VTYRLQHGVMSNVQCLANPLRFEISTPGLVHTRHVYAH